MSKEQNPNTCQQDPTRESIKIFAELLNIEFSEVVAGHPCKEIRFARFITHSGDTWNIPLNEVLAGARKFLEIHKENQELKKEAQQRNFVVAGLQTQLTDLEKELCAFQNFLTVRGLSSTEGHTITQKIMLLLISWEMKLEEAQEKNTKLGEILHTRIQEEIADTITKPLEESFKAAQQHNKEFAAKFQGAMYKSMLEIAGQEQKKVFKVLDKLLNSEDAGEFSKAQIKGRKILNAYNQAMKEHKDNG